MKLFKVIFDETKYRKSVYFCDICIYRKTHRFKEIYTMLRAIKNQINLITDIVYNTHKITELPPAKEKKREIQKQCLHLLDMVDNVCTKHGLKYWLDFGTLIGVVRHNGFIPWDDDIDICMLRSDYEKVLTYLPTQWEIEGTTFILRERQENHFQLRLCSLDNSIGLDIFPVDEFSISAHPEAKPNIERRIKQSYPLVRQISKQMGLGTDMLELRKRLSHIHIEMVLGKDTDIEGEKVLMYGIDYPHAHPECVFDKSTIFPLRQKSFEGKLYWIPNKDKEHLSYLYGDWMSYPRFV